MEPEKVKRGPGRPRKIQPPHLRLADELDDDGQVPVMPVPGGADPSPEPVRAPIFGFQRKVPARPAGLSKDARWFWDYVTEQADSFGLLKPLDGPALHVMAETYGRWREAVRMRVNTRDNERGLGMKNSQGRVTAYWVGIEERASLQFYKMCQEFGLTPAAERHVEDVGIGGSHGGTPSAGQAGGESGGGDDNPF